MKRVKMKNCFGKMVDYTVLGLVVTVAGIYVGSLIGLTMIRSYT